MKKEPDTPVVSCLSHYDPETGEVVIGMPPWLDKAAKEAIEVTCETRNFCSGFSRILGDFIANPEKRDLSKPAFLALYQLLKFYTDPADSVFLGGFRIEVLRSDIEAVAGLPALDDVRRKRLIASVDHLKATSSQGAVTNCINALLCAWEVVHHHERAYYAANLLCMISEDNVRRSEEVVDLLVDSINEIYLGDLLQEKQNPASKNKGKFREFFKKKGKKSPIEDR